MIRKLLCATAALTMFATPLMAQDADAPVDSDVATDASAEASDTRLPISRQLDPVVNPNMSVDRENIWLLDLSNGGRVAIRLKPDWAPEHVERIKTLTLQGFYNGTPFHRVIEGFMAQGGDPTGTGTGGSQLPDLQAEFNSLPHLRGSVSMARAGEEDSANSQFFIVYTPTFLLDRKYTNFGRVIGGMQYVDEINRGEPPADPTTIVQASIATQNLARPIPQPPLPAATPVEEEVTDADILGN
ncbi:peptidylprolyl isomerase [Pseudoblastomonas halimionae]|uniref:Peptidyl-prolyl cis-trans isomerase n=1 Tax=Alteriqipengyuania halimionae TaxID=1926630 RepID=A0A6I4U435_9SPHN|nr:peptidylprolyl isomerase [Alteriqipengyuania halimionae]MXP09673.1 peptidylprolyl isomerase [Alteriqipengyuania halimionae]